MSSFVEKRAFPRLDTDLACAVFINGNEYVAKVVNLSEEGICFCVLGVAAGLDLKGEFAEFQYVDIVENMQFIVQGEAQILRVTTETNLGVLLGCKIVSSKRFNSYKLYVQSKKLNYLKLA